MNGHSVPERGRERNLGYGEDGLEPGVAVDGELLDVAEYIHVQRTPADKTRTGTC